MFVYNISMKVQNVILDEWIAWQKEEHIPEIMATKLFRKYHFYRLLEQDDTEGTTFIIQYFTDSKENYDSYLLLYAPGLREKALKKWDDRFIGHRTFMEAVQ